MCNEWYLVSGDMPCPFSAIRRLLAAGSRQRSAMRRNVNRVPWPERIFFGCFCAKQKLQCSDCKVS